MHHLYRVIARRVLHIGVAALAVIGSITNGCASIDDRPEISPDTYVAATSAQYWRPPKTEEARNPVESIPIANESTVGGRLALPQLIDIALSSNPDTRRLWESARSAAASYGEAQAPYYPVATFENDAGYTRFPFQTAPGPSIVKQWETVPTFALTYTLIDFGRRRADSAIAREQLAAANFAVNRSIQTVVFEVQRTYYGLAAAEAAISAAQRNVELATTDADAVDKRVNLGLATEPALMLARERKAQAEYELENARTMVNDTRASLANAAGIPANTPFAIDDLSNQVPPKSLGAQVDELIVEALHRRPDLAAENSRLRAAEASEQRSRADWYPTVGVGAHWGEDYWQYSFDYSPVIRSSTPDTSALLMLKWDIFTGFRRLNDDRRAEAERAAQSEAVRSLALTTIAQVWSSYYDFQAAVKKYDYAQALLAAAQESYHDNLETYQRGLSTIVELLTAERDLANARFTIIQAKADLLTGAAAVLYAVGALDLPQH